MKRLNCRHATRCILCYGIVSSSSLMIAGLVLLILVGGITQATLGQVISSGNSGYDLIDIFASGNLMVELSEILIGTGMLVLLAIPVMRAMVTLVLFTEEKDRKFVMITIMVLLILAISFLVVGPMEAGIKL